VKACFLFCHHAGSSGSEPQITVGSSKDHALGAIHPKQQSSETEQLSQAEATPIADRLHPETLNAPGKDGGVTPHGSGQVDGSGKLAMAERWRVKASQDIVIKFAYPGKSTTAI
jgi:hypothetical protein